MEQKTPLYDIHNKYNGKIVPFADFLLPVQYSAGVIAEHMAVRTAAGLFDVSHMGEFILKGKDALLNLQMLLTNDFTNMEAGRARYSVMCNDEGGCVDDVIVYKYDDSTYYIVVNASNKNKDFLWMKSKITGDVTFEDISNKVSQIALQGPMAANILKKITSTEFIPQKYYHFVFNAKIKDINCVISRTGYTGEDGFEIYMENENAEKVWEMLMEAGEEHGLLPCGLGARDTLRLEAAMPLYGHEMDDKITPLETGLGFAVKMEKDGFIGKSAILQKGTPKIKRVGLKVTGRGIIREHEEIFVGEKVVGHTTSGTHCPYVNIPIAMALVDAEIEVGDKIEAMVRGRRVEAQIISLPFYKKGDLPKSI